MLRLAAGGDGVGKLEDGRTVFVPRTAPGDLVDLVGLRSHKRFARARVGRVVEPSTDRVAPRCPHYVRDECGGCQLQHLDPSAQREARRGFVGDALRRLARRDVPDPPLVASDREFDYRTKITLAVSADGRRIGLHRYDRADQVFELEWCHITVPELMELWQGLRHLRPLLPPRLQSVVLRLDRNGGRHAVFRTAAGEVWAGGTKLRDALAARGLAATIWWQAEDGAPRAMAGAGEAYPATVFEQVHPAMGDRVALWRSPRWAPWPADACGTSTPGSARPPQRSRRWVRRSRASSPIAAPWPRRSGAAHPRGATPAEWSTSSASSGGRTRDYQSAPDRHGRPDPRCPRAPAAFPRRVRLVRPRHPRARSLAPAGFRLAEVQAFDLFPQTAHVETVAVLDLAS